MDVDQLKIVAVDYRPAEPYEHNPNVSVGKLKTEQLLKADLYRDAKVGQYIHLFVSSSEPHKGIMVVSDKQYCSLTYTAPIP